MHSVFIDGQAGTTGLQLRRRLASREDITLLEPGPGLRKDADARRELVEAADLVVLCLPDDAAKATLAMDPGGATRFIDASTAHRTAPGWIYGLPEMTPDQRAAIASARLVSNPGCYPTGFIISVRPLIEAGVLSRDALITISAISGYSGGGRQLIGRYEARAGDGWQARPYALQQRHKHIPEMTAWTGLHHAPAFLPAVGHFRQGMLVSTALFRRQLTGGIDAPGIRELLYERYAEEPCINVMPCNDDSSLDQGFLDPQAANGGNRLDLFVFGHDDHVVLVARLDNLGKGASGAAVQNLNLMLQAPELEGLTP